MKFKTVYCFGDSWGYGSELKRSIGEKPFAKLIAEKLGCEIKNYARPGRSFGLITRDVSCRAQDIRDNDLVLVVVPPDSRWYTEWRTMDYEKDTAFFIDKSNDWFEYHHQLFVFSICEILNKIQCQYLLMHNYGNYPLENRKYCFSNFHHDKFLSRQSLTQLLTGRETAGTISPLELETTKKRHFSGVYFKGCIWHPNQRGHQKIADDILEKLSIKSNDAN